MGRLLHYAFELVLVSTAFSGARRVAGVDLDRKKLIENETASTVLNQYLKVGDAVIDYSAAYLKKNEYFVPKR
ncbi:uncharacterized protein EV422DRAFT_565543 [Fimicolochytrium jonesii]|uniref:uncharacterized protein n=1 Tax=Fimicolochytrium jonesii TaxID=1396493 RepID=UPI0022FE7D58|nr:uncharacterized protein EV422DRAFT_565543 [Fimicolochytrium jonesii]KAI8823607.1 hypothetical protein EV422DRAFT_565543 [Fimicolochytrium jonesii]